MRILRNYISSWLSILEGICGVVTFGLWTPNFVYEWALFTVKKGWVL